ncbi:sensor histidine kinase [Streptomyces jumonjinensis]|uniref:histidine kinase n=1 Tax=Streptomyces jumonjinensis TaxID=1945 RepID=A0A646K9K4_STRJU|nr:histidine kinase [Streptomyces jumonjinensis]MQS98871.1 two-component sensor histidine kinase [Streptomyces jumonjinensis]
MRRAAAGRVLDGRVTIPRPHRDDVLIGAGTFLGGLLLWSLGLNLHGGHSELPHWAALVPLAVICAQELFRRSLPLTTLAVGTLALIADLFTVGSLFTVLAFTDVVYAAVVYGSPATARRVPVTAALLTVASAIGLMVLLQDPEGLFLGVLFGVLTLTPSITGVVIRNHREAAGAARLRAEQTALLAEMDRVQAVAAERARMARELHDMVANHLSAIAIHSTAALSLDDPGTTRQALGVIRENSVAGLAEMRRLIGLLRQSDDDDEPAAAPTLAGLEALVRQACVNGAGSGLDFALDDRREDGPALPAPVELAAYRIVQESLTNALKHAAPGEVRVQLTHAAGRALTVTVSSPFGSRPGPRAPGSGAGLVGMRERVALLGGEITAGPAAGPPGGPARIWCVRAVLPVPDGKEHSA